MTTRKTTHKQNVLTIISKSKHALSADDVLVQLDQTANKTTVYRILDQFEKDGLVHKIIGMDHKAYYSICHNNCGHNHHDDFHAHFQCKKCFELQCIAFETPLPKIKDLTIETQQVLLIGVCGFCR